MIPILYSPLEKNFVNNGVGRLTDCMSCTVTEERNGIYECEFTYPINGKWYDYLINNKCFVGVIHDDHHDVQPFEVYGYDAPIDGIVTFYAHHISYNLNNVIVNDIEADTCAEAFVQLKTQSLTENNFTFWTDKPTSGTFKVTAPSGIRALLVGQQGSILDVYGSGEYEFDKYTVKLHAHRGTDRGVTIRYGKNLTDIKRSFDKGASFNTVFPFWQDAEGNTVTLPEKYIASIADAIKYPWENETNGNIMQDGDGHDIEFNHYVMIASPLDLSQEFEEQPTEAELRAKAAAYLENNKPWIPQDNIEINFVQLWQTPEYENVAVLQRVSLCDTVAVYYPELGVTNASAKVIRIVYNVLSEEYASMELGEARTSYAEAMKQALRSDIAEIAENEATSIAQEAIAYATKQITGGLGGYVVMNLNAAGQPQEILIMDTDDINTAVNVIRMNRNGIGFSMTGYEGPYTSAWTIDGHFNADFITTGTMLANRIYGGTLTVGGLDNQAGVFIVKDENGDTVVRGDKDGLITKALVAQDYISCTGTDGSYFYMPWTSLQGDAGYLRVDYLGLVIHEKNTTITLGHPLIGYLPDDTPYYLDETAFMIENNRASVWMTAERFSKTATDSNGDSGGRIDFLDNSANPQSGQIITISPPDAYTHTTGDTDYTYIGYDAILCNEIGGEHYVWTNGALLGDTLTISGTKNRLVKTKEYGERLLYCYETPSPMFGDVGEGVIDETGFCYVFLDAVFAETISTNQYQVFLQKYGQGDCWIAERKSGYFVVQGTAGLSFGWELKAKQSDFSQERLERYDNPREKQTQKSIDYGAEAVKYLKDLKEGRQPA